MTADDKVEVALRAVRARGLSGPFDAALVLGTGLGGLAAAVEEPVRIPYGDIPHVPPAGVSGHEGALIGGRLEGRRVLVLSGRLHTYEQGDPAAMRVPLGLVAALGAGVLVLTNASGGIADGLDSGACALISDHINLTGLNPLIGETGDGRFVPMTNAYDPELRRLAREAAAAIGLTLPEATYMWFAGPSFETPSEIRAAGRLGADLVGMSTVPEVVIARYLGLRVLALSLVTNRAAGLADTVHDHAGTKAAGDAAAPGLHRLLRAILSRLPEAVP